MTGVCRNRRTFLEFLHRRKTLQDGGLTAGQRTAQEPAVCFLFPVDCERFLMTVATAFPNLHQGGFVPNANSGSERSENSQMNHFCYNSSGGHRCPPNRGNRSESARICRVWRYLQTCMDLKGWPWGAWSQTFCHFIGKNVSLYLVCTGRAIFAVANINHPNLLSTYARVYRSTDLRAAPGINLYT